MRVPKILRVAGIAVSLTAGLVAVAQRQRDPLTPPEIDKIRDAC